MSTVKLADLCQGEKFQLDGTIWTISQVYDNNGSYAFNPKTSEIRYLKDELEVVQMVNPVPYPELVVLLDYLTVLDTSKDNAEYDGCVDDTATMLRLLKKYW